MASLSSDEFGRRRILFFGPDGTRKQIRLGKQSMKFAESFKRKIEHLLAAKISGEPIDPEIALWVADLPDTFAKKLSATGLLSDRDDTRLAPFLRSYISRQKLKPSTIINLERAEKDLISFFGESKSIREITPGCADEWRTFLLSQRSLSENTVRRLCGRAKQMFRSAVRKKLISDNPFSDLASSVGTNLERFFFVTREMSEKVLDECPDAEWRLIFALSRFGGLRCPSEHLRLRWIDIDFANDRFRVWSPKTEHRQGGASRMVPIFPELLPFLEDSRELAAPDAEYVIRRSRSSATNLRSQFERIIRHAGLEPWPKLFQNLRSTRETELAEQFPIHVVCRWLGNSQPVAVKHYLQVTDEHFRKAAQKAAQSPAVDEENTRSEKDTTSQNLGK